MRHVLAILVLVLLHGTAVRAAEIFDAIRKGDVEKVKAILDAKPNQVSAVRSGGYRPIHDAAHQGRPEIVKLLIERGADVNAKTHSKVTPLHLACHHCNACFDLKRKRAVAEILVAHGADLHAVSYLRERYGATPLHLAAGYDIAHYAALSGEMALVKRYPPKPERINARSKSGWTYLHCAAKGGNDEVVALFLSMGAEADARTDAGMTVLFYAAQYCSEKAVKLLLEKGADVHGTNEFGWTALHRACSRGNAAMTRLLLEHGADIEARSRSGQKPLHLAARSEDLATVMVLLERKPQVNVVQDAAATPLHYAACEGADGVVKLLLQYGAFTRIQDLYGRTPAAAAERYGHPETAAIIKAWETKHPEARQAHIPLDDTVRLASIRNHKDDG